jgi:hypothetical protein
MPGREPQRLGVAATVGRDVGFEHDHTARYGDDCDRVRIAVRVDTDNEVQLICKHHRSTSSPGWGDNSGAGLGVRPLTAGL